MRIGMIAAAMGLLPLVAHAEQTTLIDTSALPSQTIYEVAQLTPLVLSAEGSPATVLVDLDAGDVVQPHPAPNVMRIITVVSGQVWFGDGDELNPAFETAYPAGSILVMPANQMHWAAARNGDVRLQLVLLDDETPVPGIEEQMQ